MRLCANLQYLFTEHPFLERFDAAARAGFTAVEYQYPYRHDRDATVRALSASGLEMALFNLNPGDFAAGERGLACLPDRQDDFVRALDEAAEWAEALGCRRVNALAGIAGPDLDGDRCIALLAERLRFAAERLSSAGVRVLVEPINDRDLPGYAVPRVSDALAVLDAAGHPGLGLLFDAYHAAVVGDDPASLFAAAAARVEHVQIADAPGRHEPGTGCVDFERFFATLDRLAYRGWVSLEYAPLHGTGESLDWARPWLRPAARS